jgi:cation:H+ antiporter
MNEVAIQSGFFILGLLGLSFGAEWLVKGSSRIAKDLGVKPVVIGLTIVAFGTSSPELVVSLLAAIKKSEGIAIGNIIGSNIANIGLILGLSALVSPLKVHSSVVRYDLPVMIGVSVIFVFMVLDKKIGFVNGLILFLGLLGYTANHLYNAIKVSKSNQKATCETALDKDGSWAMNLLLIIVGFALLLGGAHLMVRSGVVLARMLGVSEVIIGMTLVSIGTSLPELATSVFCAIRKESDLLVGTVVGSNIFNILCVLGIVGMVSPLSVDRSLLLFEIPVLLLFSFALVPFMKSGFILNRIEGGTLLGGYVGFIALLFWLA